MPSVVMLATPSFSGSCSVEYVMSLSATQAMLSSSNIDCVLSILSRNPYLAEVRNILASRALVEPSVTDLFFLDDDIGWPPQKVLEFIQRPEDVIAGVYPKKKDGGGWPCTLDQKDGRPIEVNGLYLASMIPAGFLRIKRSALEKMAAGSQEYKDSQTGERVWSFFEAKTVADASQALFWGEDYWFSHCWRAIGGECWVDPEIDFSHVGSKVYSGNLGEAIRATLKATGR